MPTNMAEPTTAGVPPGSAAGTSDAATPPGGASSLPKQDDISSRVQKANSPGELRAIMDDLKKPAPAAAKPAESTPSADATPPAGETPAEETPPAEGAEPASGEGETPAGDETPAAETTDDAEEAPESGEEPETPVTPSAAKRLRVRLPENDEVGRLATAYLQRNRDWTLAEAMEAAKKQLGVAPDAPAAGKPGEAPAKSDLPETVEAVDAAADKLMDEKDKAIAEIRLEDVARIDRQLRKLDRHRVDLQRAEERQTAEAVAGYQEQFDASEAQAATLYDFASKPDSEGGKRMIEIEESLKATNDPLYFDPNKPLIIAQMVGREFKIAPRRKGPAPAPAKPAAPVQATQKKQVLPGGASRTVPPTAGTQTEEAAKISQIKTPLELRRFAESKGLKLAGL